MTFGCEVCHASASRYVCSKCGRRSCGGCFDTALWECVNCRPREVGRPTAQVRFFNALPYLSIVGISFIFIGLVIMAVASISPPVKGGFVFIWPFGFIYSGDSWRIHPILAVLGAVAVLLPILFLLLRMRPWRREALVGE